MSWTPSESTRAVALALMVAAATALVVPVGGVAANGQQSSADIVVQNGESIQQAVNDAQSGDVIAVEPGQYNETVRVNVTDVTIKATDPSDQPVVHYEPDRPRSNATFEIIASGVTLSNLTIERVGHPDRTGDNATAAVAIVPVDHERPDCTFSFSGCEDVTKDVTVKGSDVVGDFALNDTAAGVVITDGIEFSGVEIEGQASNIAVTNTEITGFSAGAGLAAEYGGTIADVLFAGNYIHDNQAEQNGSPEGTGVGFVRNTTQGEFKNVTVTDNNISANDYGVRLAGNATNETLVDVDASAISVNFNDIAGNTEWGALNNGTNTLDATDNWWGSDDGPSGAGDGSGDAVSEGVAFKPYLNSSTT